MTVARGGPRPPLFRWACLLAAVSLGAGATPPPPSPAPSAAPAPEEPAARDQRLTRLLVAEGRRLRILEDGEAHERYEESRRAVLRDAVEQRLVTPRAVVTDAEVEVEYQRNRDKFAGSPRLKLRHVFRRVSATADAGEKARAAAEMQGIRARIAAGADMGELARTLSDSQTARFDGMLMPVARGAIDPAVDGVVWRLEVGQVSDVVVTPIGLHVFRLEERMPGAPLDEATARNVVRQRLRVAARARARAEVRSLLLESSGARYTPRLAGPRRPAGEVWYERPGRTLTAGGMAAQIRALPFAAQRTRSVGERLEEEVWSDLLLLEAERTKVAEDPTVAQRLVALEQDSLREAAWARRLRLHQERITDADLLPFLAATAAPVSPEQRRLRALVVSFAPGHTAHYWYEQAEAIARDVRAGRRDLAEAARALSDDPSAPDGGDLGAPDLRELASWAGMAIPEKVRALAPRELGGPWLVEVYDESQFSYEPRGYVLLRVESVEASAPLTGAAAREAALRAYLYANAGAIVRALEDEVLSTERTSTG